MVGGQSGRPPSACRFFLSREFGCGLLPACHWTLDCQLPEGCGLRFKKKKRTEGGRGGEGRGEGRWDSSRRTETTLASDAQPTIRSNYNFQLTEAWPCLIGAIRQKWASWEVAVGLPRQGSSLKDQNNTGKSMNTHSQERQYHLRKTKYTRQLDTYILTDVDIDSSKSLTTLMVWNGNKTFSFTPQSLIHPCLGSQLSFTWASRPRLFSSTSSALFLQITSCSVTCILIHPLNHWCPAATHDCIWSNSTSYHPECTW